MTTIAVNNYVALKGTSGSSRGAQLIGSALREAASTVEVRPDGEPPTRLLRLLSMIWWDEWGAVRAAAKAGARVVIHTANTGGAGRGARSILLLHDTMVLDHPRLFNPAFVAYARLSFPRAVRRASAIVAPS